MAERKKERKVGVKTPYGKTVNTPRRSPIPKSRPKISELSVSGAVSNFRAFARNAGLPQPSGPEFQKLVKRMEKGKSKRRK